MTELRQLLYISRASPGLSPMGLRQLLADASRKNWRQQVTGCLLYTGRAFAQLLEGEGEVVRGLAGRIATHPWHHDLRVLFDRPVDRRHYPAWSMGYVYSLDLADRLDQLWAAGTVSDGDIASLLALLRPDPVMGPLDGAP